MGVIWIPTKNHLHNYPCMSISCEGIYDSVIEKDWTTTSMNNFRACILLHLALGRRSPQVDWKIEVQLTIWYTILLSHCPCCIRIHVVVSGPLSDACVVKTNMRSYRPDTPGEDTIKLVFHPLEAYKEHHAHRVFALYT